MSILPLSWYAAQMERPDCTTPVAYECHFGGVAGVGTLASRGEGGRCEVEWARMKVRMRAEAWTCVIWVLRGVNG